MELAVSIELVAEQVEDEHGSGRQLGHDLGQGALVDLGNEHPLAQAPVQVRVVDGQARDALDEICPGRVASGVDAFGLEKRRNQAARWSSCRCFR